MSFSDGVLRLEQPREEWADSVMEFRQSFADAGEDFINGSQQLHRFENFSSWLGAVRLCAAGPNGPLGVPSTLFLAFREEDGVLVGCIDVRHTLNDGLRRLGGHIGYSIAPPFRRRGYARRMLLLALEFARQLGIKEVQIDCDTANMPSAKTILGAGGLPVKEDILTMRDGSSLAVTYFRIPI